jgi:hypothetical protein
MMMIQLMDLSLSPKIFIFECDRRTHPGATHGANRVPVLVVPVRSVS